MMKADTRGDDPILVYANGRFEREVTVFCMTSSLWKSSAYCADLQVFKKPKVSGFEQQAGFHQSKVADWRDQMSSMNPIENRETVKLKLRRL
jgi:hypothetical protein